MSVSHQYDVVIAGGGPSGSSTANFLRQKGRSVLVLERERFPRFHIGESLLPFTNDLWKELGVFEHLDTTCMRKPGAYFIHEESGNEFSYYFDTAIRPGRPYAFQVKRAEFDKLLLDRARELGAEIREHQKVLGYTPNADGVVVRALDETSGTEYEVTAKMFVDATGRDALLAGKHQWKEPDALITTNVAVHCMWKGIERLPGPDEGNIIIGLFDGGWYWVIPFTGEETSIGMVLEKSYTKVNRGLTSEELYRTVVKTLPHLRERMKNATPVLDFGAQGNWSYRSKHFFAERALLVGDAAAFVDPLFSTGVLLGVTGAKYAAEHIDRAIAANDFSVDNFATYQQQVIAGMEIFKQLVNEFYAQNLRLVLMASASNATICQVITSILAGDVFRPAIWHGLVRKEGFSNFAVPAAPDDRPVAKSSREAGAPQLPTTP